jgi:repressor LexA
MGRKHLIPCPNGQYIDLMDPQRTLEPATRPLTDRQREVLDFIRDRVRDSHRPPTVREIGDHFDIRSTNGVRVILDALEKKGQLKRSPRLSRGLSVIDSPADLEAAEAFVAPVAAKGTSRDIGLHEDLIRVPLLGRVAAGAPILALEHAEDTLVIPRSLLPTKEAFALKVRGDSMQEAGILDGDIVFAHPQNQAHKGETVVAPGWRRRHGQGLLPRGRQGPTPAQECFVFADLGHIHESGFSNSGQGRRSLPHALTTWILSVATPNRVPRGLGGCGLRGVVPVG